MPLDPHSFLPHGLLGGSGFPALDKLRSAASMDSGGNDPDVHTLDYLGLDRVHCAPAATISELHSQAQATDRTVPALPRI